jgi:hypothetical protein
MEHGDSWQEEAGLKRDWLMRLSMGALLALVLVFGCANNRRNGVSGPTAAAAPARLTTFFVDWLKTHGEKSIVTGKDGVGVAGNATRIRASIYGSDRRGAGYLVETEFNIHLPSGVDITEFVAGVGETEDKALDDTLVNFALTTFHPIYKCYINPADPHQPLDRISQPGGGAREIAMGDLLTRGGDGSKKDFGPVRKGVKAAVAAVKLPDGPHWIKIVYGRAKDTSANVSVTLDNSENPELMSAVKELTWPPAGAGYIAKQFILVK